MLNKVRVLGSYNVAKFSRKVLAKPGKVRVVGSNKLAKLIRQVLAIT